MEKSEGLAGGLGGLERGRPPGDTEVTEGGETMSRRPRRCNGMPVARGSVAGRPWAGLRTSAGACTDRASRPATEASDPFPAPDVRRRHPMRVPHYAMRSLAVVALIGLMTGCGGNDSTAPDAPFDPAGTSSDIDAIGASYESNAMYGFQSAMPAISTTLAETAAAVARRAAPSNIMANGKTGAREYAGALTRLYTAPTPGMRPVGSRAAILEEHLGKTFVRNPETLEYEVSNRTGAPS